MPLRPCLALALMTAACGSSGAKADLENVRTTRSLLAELALVSEMRPVGTYTRQMQAEATQQLATTADAARASGSAEGAAIADLASVPANAQAASIRERVDRARAIESRLAGR